MTSHITTSSIIKFVAMALLVPTLTFAESGEKTKSNSARVSSASSTKSQTHSTSQEYDCDQTRDLKALQNRQACNHNAQKSKSHWLKMSAAEYSVIELLKVKKTAELAKYISCDAFDLSWQNPPCEIDRIKVTEEHLKKIIEILHNHKIKFGKPNWIRNRPNYREIRNPNWLQRSRLIVSDFPLGPPWNSKKHPTENGTVILLEQKLDGKITVVGAPITGLPSE